MSETRDTIERRWLLIQVHRARIAYILRTDRRRFAAEIAERMNAIALLCDRGRTERGRALAARLATGERHMVPIVTELLAGREFEQVV